MTDELKPCPFCGAEAGTNERTDVQASPDAYNSWMVLCGNCGCATSGDESHDDAIATWNRRASSSTASVRLIEAAKLCRKHMYENASNTGDRAFDKLCEALDELESTASVSEPDKLQAVALSEVQEREVFDAAWNDWLAKENIHGGFVSHQDFMAGYRAALSENKR